MATSLNSNLAESDSMSSSTAASVMAYPRPEELPADARALLAQAGQRNIELGFDWYANLVATVYKDSVGLRFYVLRRAGQAVAVLPVKVEPLGIGQKISALSNFYTALYEPAFEADLVVGDLKLLLITLKKDFPRAHCLWFSPMDPASVAYNLLLQTCRETGWAAFEFFCFGNWYLRVNEAWTSYFEKRAGAVRSTVKRMSKKFAAAGGRLQIVRDLSDLPQAIAAYEHIYAKSWKKPEPHSDFIPGLVNTFGRSGHLLMGIAWMGEQAVASQLWLIDGRRAEIYKLAYDEAFKEYSPGTLLTRQLMEQAFDQTREIDYLIGDDAYKSAWMSDRRERWGFVAYRVFSLPGSMSIVRELASRTAKRLIRRFRGGAIAETTQVAANFHSANSP